MTKLRFLEFLTLLLFTLALGHSSWAAPWEPTSSDKEDGRVEWHKYFDGDPRVTDDLPDLEEQMKINHLMCGQSVREILSLVQEYGEKVTSRNPQRASRIYEGIWDKINSAEADKSECLIPMKQAYVIGSSFILFKDLRKYNSHSNPDGWFIYSPYSSPEIALKVIYLFSQNKIDFLSDDLPQPILGAYQCESSKIYVSLSQRPYDLGATMIHEMDHLFRDKFIALDILKEQFPSGSSENSGGSQIDWRTYTLVDETLASTEATYAQRALQFGFDDWGDSLNFRGMAKQNPYEATGDFSFVAPHRPLEAFLDFTHELPHPTLLLRTISVDDFSHPNPACHPRNQDETGCPPGVVQNVKSAEDLKKANSFLEQVYTIVSRSYFNSALTRRQWNVLKLNMRPDNPADYFDYNKVPEYVALSRFEGDSFYFYDGPLIFNPYHTPDPPHQFPVDYQMQFINSRDYPKANGYVVADKLLGKLKLIHDQLNEPSGQCLDFRKAMEAGQLNDYLGTKVVADDIRPGNGVKTGNGVKPGNGVKTGNGVKPGNGVKTDSSVKPGNGVKTFTTARPCILPTEKL